MSEKYVTVFCYWGGNVTSTVEGLSYDRDYEESIWVATTTTYDQLIVELCKILGVGEDRVRINVTYRYPVIIGSAAHYRPFRVKNDNGVRGMMNAVDQLKWSHVDLYLDYQDLSVDSPRHVPVIADVQRRPILNSEGDHASNSHDLQSPNSPVLAEFAEWGAVQELVEYEEQTGVAASVVPPTLENMMVEEDSIFGLDVDNSVDLDCNNNVDIDDELNANEGVEVGEQELHQPASQLFTTLSESSTAASTSRFHCLNWDPKTDEPRVGVFINMAVKNQKLQDQFNAEAWSSSNGGSSSRKPIFRGVSIFVDGFTIPSRVARVYAKAWRTV